MLQYLYTRMRYDIATFTFADMDSGRQRSSDSKDQSEPNQSFLDSSYINVQQDSAYQYEMFDLQTQTPIPAQSDIPEHSIDHSFDVSKDGFQVDDTGIDGNENLHGHSTEEAHDDLHALLNSQDDFSDNFSDGSASEDSAFDDVLGEDESENNWQRQVLSDMMTALQYTGHTSPEGLELIVLPRNTAVKIRNDLFALGPVQFIVKYCVRNVAQYDIGEVVSALGFRLPRVYVDSADEAKLQLILRTAIRFAMSKRQRLSHPRTLDELVESIGKAQNIIVLTGAGISTSLGIPDFRSDDGLYKKLSYLGLSDPQEVFDIRLFREDPTIFYSIARQVMPTHTRYSPTHQFIRMLHEHKKLLRNYTQNIDNLEKIAGIPSDKIIQCHGSFGSAHCMTCRRQVEGESLKQDILEGNVPICKACAKQRAKLDREDRLVDQSFGVMKPDIIFFGENLPDHFDKTLMEDGGDAVKCDLLICIGTSLKVAPVSEVTKIVPPDIPQIYISKTPAKHCNFEVSMLGPCDDVVELLCSKLGWALNHEMAKRPSDMPDDEFPSGCIREKDGEFLFITKGTN